MAKSRLSLQDVAGTDGLIKNGPIEIDVKRLELRVGGEVRKLGGKPLDLLAFFMLNQGRMLTYQEIITAVWGPGYTQQIQYLRVALTEVRRAIDDNPVEPEIIKRRRGEGYLMETLMAPKNENERQSLTIAEFTLSKYPMHEGVTIQRCDGEGGNFKEADLAEAIRAFYNANF